MKREFTGFKYLWGWNKYCYETNRDMWGDQFTTFDLIKTFLRDVYRETVCYVFGHKLVNDEIADPEYGPNPDVYCTRCQKQF